VSDAARGRGGRVLSDVTLSIDGKEVTVARGTLIIRAAEQLGIEIPRFCDHPFLAPAGACRQCFVQVEGQPKLATSCTMTVAPDMVVHTQNTSDEVTQAQIANLEFLLLNHPLDCPICDRGGECPLQDQALAFGPGESRFREAKRVYPKPVPLSPLVNLDRERCVLCARCTRFCDEISGDRFIELFARGAGERVSIAAGEDFRSPFSGNTIQICPVGALTSTPYRFVARPFDLTSGDSVCNHCSAGCNVRVDVRRGEIVRVLARDNVDVNDAWICDKGRFAFAWPDAPGRITTPLLRGQGLEGASFGEVLSWVAARCTGARVAFLTGGRLMDEDYYALSKLARTVFGTNDLDHRRASGAVEAERQAAATPMAVTSEVLERATTILVVGLDAENEVPILHLRLRKAARGGAGITVLHPRRTRLHDVAAHVLAAPGADAELLAKAVGGQATGDPTLDAAVATLREAGTDGVVLAGERSPQAADLALRLAASTGSRFGYVTRRANDRGALRAGVHPALLPGGRMLEEPDDVERVWGPIVNRQTGRDANAILEACARREVDVLFLVGIDPLRDVPDAALARRALDNVPVKVVQSLELGDLEPFADAFLPAAPSIEKHGHMTDWEGRPQPIVPVRQALGLSRPDWEIFAGLALAAGGDLGFETLEELHAEMDRLLASGPADVPALEPVTMPRPDGMQLISYPLLIDDGRLSRDAPELKAALQDEPFVEIHPEDAPSGVADGGRAVVRTEAGQAELVVRVTSHIARGVIFVPFNQAGFAANRLLSGSFTTTARIEAVERVEEASV
jgi:NADH-quinone oxidoreductase subunit G